jgi:protein disulfide-isomerase A1
LKGDGVTLAKVDCTEEQNLCADHSVQGYPTLKLFRKGVPFEYKGSRVSDGIISYMRKQMLPAVSEIGPEKFDDFIKMEKVAVVAYFPRGTESPHFKAFQTAAESNRDAPHVYGYAKDPKHLDSSHTYSNATIVVYKSFDEPKVEYEGDLSDAEELSAFIKRESFPIMDEITPENYMSYVESGLPMAFFFYDNDESRTTDGRKIEKVAKDYKGKMSFVYCDAKKFGAHAETLNLKLQFPAFGVSKAEDGLKWPLDQDKEISEESVRALVAGIVNGTLDPSLKSAEEPANNSGPVKIVVGTNFEKIVFDKTKDALVEFYAPCTSFCLFFFC